MYTDIDLIEERPTSIGDIRRDDFLKLANKRLPKALESIRLIKNLLANPYRYLYSNEDLDLIIRKLHVAIDELKMYKKHATFN